MTVSTKQLLFQVRNSGDSAWITVGGAHNIDLPKAEVNHVEEPDFANLVKVTRPGRVKVGSGSVDITWDRTNLGQAELEALESSNAERAMKIVLVDSDAVLTLDNINFSAIVTYIDYNAAQNEDSIWMSKVGLKLTTFPVRSAT